MHYRLSGCQAKRLYPFDQKLPSVRFKSVSWMPSIRSPQNGVKYASHVDIVGPVIHNSCVRSTIHKYLNNTSVASNKRHPIVMQVAPKRSHPCKAYTTHYSCRHGRHRYNTSGTRRRCMVSSEVGFQSAMYYCEFIACRRLKTRREEENGEIQVQVQYAVARIQPMFVSCALRANAESSRPFSTLKKNPGLIRRFCLIDLDLIRATPRQRQL